jgi:N-acetylmuramoyl-L-alanine amidase
MPKRYTVRRGDCVASIAYQHGHFSDTLWNHAQNAGLKSKRRDPYVLGEGDVIIVPDLELGNETVATSKVHRFRRRGVPEKLSVQLLNHDTPFATRSYTLRVDGTVLSGTSDADGVVERWIAPDAKSAQLSFTPLEGEDPDTLTWTFELGALAPIEDEAGVVARIENLAYDVTSEGDEALPPAERATKVIMEMQIAEGLPPTGELDSKTLYALAKRHGC